MCYEPSRNGTILRSDRLENARGRQRNVRLLNFSLEADRQLAAQTRRFKRPSEGQRDSGRNQPLRTPRLGRLRPIDALCEGRIGEVIEAARSYGELGAA